MARLHLLRHGRAAAGFGDDHDPGLDDEGRSQAAGAARVLAPLGPLPIVVSPLRRTRETAAALEALWGVEALVEPRVSEIPSPTDDLEARVSWLRDAMAGGWSDLGPAQIRWRDELIRYLAGLTTDTVIVTHFIAINVVLGSASRDDAVVQAMVANASCTVAEWDGAGFGIVEGGAPGGSTVL